MSHVSKAMDRRTTTKRITNKFPSLGNHLYYSVVQKVFFVTIAKGKWQCHNFAKNKLWKRITFHVTWFDQWDVLVGQWGNCHWFKPYTSLTSLLHDSLSLSRRMRAATARGWKNSSSAAVQNKPIPAMKTARLGPLSAPVGSMFALGFLSSVLQPVFFPGFSTISRVEGRRKRDLKVPLSAFGGSYQHFQGFISLPEKPTSFSLHAVTQDRGFPLYLLLICPSVLANAECVGYRAVELYKLCRAPLSSR